jgi:hypothetical protein
VPTGESVPATVPAPALLYPLAAGK